jgi:hypothetical protein
MATWHHNMGFEAFFSEQQLFMVSRNEDGSAPTKWTVVEKQISM